jgi:phage tail sheath protein FI
MATYSAPGVYIEEISTFPPSVAEVSTAIPAFIGYTANGPAATLEPKVERINTLLEYETMFGTAQPSKFTVDASSIEKLNRDKGVADFMLYYSLSLYFKNGGGSCYIVSIGNYKDAPSKASFEAGLTALEMEDEPTLIVFPDALNLAVDDYYDLCQQALTQCNKLGDRFTLLDVPDGDEDVIAAFRNGIVSDNLMYGAAYYPYLQTSLNYHYLEDEVSIENLEVDSGTTWKLAFGEDGNGIVVSYTGSGDSPKVKIVAGSLGNVAFSVNTTTQVLLIENVAEKPGNSIVTAWIAWKDDANNDPAGFDISKEGDGSYLIPHTSNANIPLEQQDGGQSLTKTLKAIKDSKTALYNQIKAALNQQRVTLPPSPAIAGVYARVDRERGVWKAPANVSLAAVIGPLRKITDEAQGKLNIHEDGGKSINAIRAFTGKGTLVWGARTLAGNDNEWRYISVRRLFNMIEESSKKATAFAVFEANDATTWLKVKAMIESYLYGLWERGALAGSTSEAAYFVNIGLGKTMTPQDILEGRMNVEIGVAAVRPAEFIILKFTHKLQET